MDTPTVVIIISIVIIIVCTIAVKTLNVPHTKKLGILLPVIGVIFIVIDLLGEELTTWAGNATCSKYLGCVAGFAGYDAFEHLFFGVGGTILVVWLCERFPKYSILHKENWKTILVILGMIALIAVAWEIAECAYDALRLNVFHEALISFRLHINFLGQPSNLDTMGDLTFTLLGSFFGLLAIFKPAQTTE